MTKMFFKGADAAIIVYDITDKISFVRAQKWITELIKVGETELND